MWLSCAYSAGTMGSESETERKPEVPASTRDEALFHCTTPSGVPRGPYQLHSIPEFSQAQWEAPWGHRHKLREPWVFCRDSRKTARVLQNVLSRDSPTMTRKFTLTRWVLLPCKDPSAHASYDPSKSAGMWYTLNVAHQEMLLQRSRKGHSCSLEFLPSTHLIDK